MTYPARCRISGFSGGNVYFLVHPLQSKFWWVQRLPSKIDDDGTWQALCQFGERNVGIGEYFEIIAIITNSTLTAGQKIEVGRLPRDVIKSAVVTVKRTR
jgi:hypothetical protein